MKWKFYTDLDLLSLVSTVWKTPWSLDFPVSMMEISGEEG